MTSSTRVVNTRPCIFQISSRRRIFWEIFGMVVQCMEDKRTTRLTCSCRCTWRWRPLIRVSAQRNTTTKTQDNLVCPAFSNPPSDEVAKTLIFRVGPFGELTVIQKRCLRTHGSWDVSEWVGTTWFSEANAERFVLGTTETVRAGYSHRRTTTGLLRELIPFKESETESE